MISSILLGVIGLLFCNPENVISSAYLVYLISSSCANLSRSLSRFIVKKFAKRGLVGAP